MTGLFPDERIRQCREARELRLHGYLLWVIEMCFNVALLNVIREAIPSRIMSQFGGKHNMC